MHDGWFNALNLAAAIACSGLGFAWLALSMEVHWEQVRGPGPASPSTVRLLRVLGAAGLALSLVLCAVADHPTMAALVWIMSLALGAFCVAMTLTWRPQVLSVLAFGQPKA